MINQKSETKRLVQSEAVEMEVVVVVAVEDIPLKNEAASPRQMGHVRLDCKEIREIVKIFFWSKTNLTILYTYL